MKPQITIFYPDDIFGDVAVSVNGIHIKTLKKQEAYSFETYPGINRLSIRVAGSSYQAFEKDFLIEKDQEFIVKGFFSKVKMFSWLIELLIIDLILVFGFFKLEIIQSNFLLFVISLAIPVVVKVMISLHYFFVKKGKYVFLEEK
ncbi:MAG: hypothetical protein O9340_00060 [Cyclobacteriaceae bacterium]|jgi:hypothetical protein|nr:hypothetical protein [Cyclobacteriaceae bacterium]